MGPLQCRAAAASHALARCEAAEPSTHRPSQSPGQPNPSASGPGPPHPRTQGRVERDGKQYVKMADIVSGMSEPHVMDVKLGLRSFLESEVCATGVTGCGAVRWGGVSGRRHKLPLCPFRPAGR